MNKRLIMWHCDKCNNDIYIGPFTQAVCCPFCQSTDIFAEMEVHVKVVSEINLEDFEETTE